MQAKRAYKNFDCENFFEKGHNARTCKRTIVKNKNAKKKKKESDQAPVLAPLPIPVSTASSRTRTGPSISSTNLGIQSFKNDNSKR